MSGHETTTLCDTAKLLSSALDGASERAVLVADNGLVLHLNPAARHFVFCHPPNSHNNDNDDGAAPTTTHISDILVGGIDGDKNSDPDSWKTIQHCRIIMSNGHSTRSERNIHVVALALCPCCQQRYYTVYICSKHERVREIVDHALDPVITMDNLGQICTANDACCELFGYSEAELVGHNLGMLCGGGVSGEAHNAALQRYLQTGQAHVIGTRREVWARTKDGAEVPVELAVQEISDASTGKRYFCGYMKDLTRVKQHEAEIEERQALAQAMINASFDSMLEIDETGAIRLVNDAACHMFGYTRDELLGSNISMICGDGHAEHHEAYMQRYLETGEAHIIGRKRQVKARRKDGSELEVELGVQEVTLTDGKKAFCGFIRDLTAQKKDKRALRKQQQIIHNKFFGKEEEAVGNGET